MADIFISYKREEQPIANKLADALQKKGWSVWWDPEIRAGERFDDVIEKALIESKCVVVLWSKLSVVSQNVKDEATYALNRDKLVPILIEEVNLPFRFERINTGQLIDWDGSDKFPAYQKLVSDITKIIAEEDKRRRKEAEREAENGRRRKQEAERKLREDEKKKAEEERQRLEEEKHRKAEEKRKFDEEQKRIVSARKAEKERKQKEARAKRTADDEKRRKKKEELERETKDKPKKTIPPDTLVLPGSLKKRLILRLGRETKDKLNKFIDKPNKTKSPDLQIVIPESSYSYSKRKELEIERKRRIGDFVLIPKGKFVMGSPPDEPGRDDNEKQHEVRINKQFYLQTTEVSQGQWVKVMGNNPSRFKCGNDCPVESVSWYMAQKFISKLNQIEDTNKYRLPTEAEWEYACRAGTETAYSFDEVDKLDEYAWYRDNSERQTHPVGKKKPNDWGLYDMHGNVWEWCQDWYSDYPSTSSVPDPKGPDKGKGRVLRGGSWNSDAEKLRSAKRRGYDPNYRISNFGFRVARDF